MRAPRSAQATATRTTAGGRRYLLARVAAAILAALLAGTCRDNGVPTSPGEPVSQTATPQDTAAILVGAGEVERCDNTLGEATARLLDTIPGTVFTTGDNIRYSGALTEFTACYDPSWGRHKGRTRPALGGYEYQTAGAAGYFDYFGSAAGERGQGYYSYELGAWHIVVLNSTIAMSVGSAQEQWLRADLAASGKRCTLAYWQHPRFSSALAPAVRAAVKPVWDALYDAGAEVVLNGHDRVYERFAPQSPEEVADAEHGLRQFTVGTGGHGVNVFGPTVRPNSEVRLSGTYGVLKLTLGDGTYSWRFIPIMGQTATDFGSGTCHEAPAVSPSRSTVRAGPGLLEAGNGTATITVTARDSAGNPVSGARVELAVTGSDNTLTQPSGPTDPSGVATGTLGSAVAEVKLVTATINGIAVRQGATVAVTAPGAAPILVGAGEVERCDNTVGEATARLLDTIPGTVFTTGDNIRYSGALTEFTTCYDPSWGRHKGRTRPALGGYEYQTARAAGYFDYFGSAAGERDKGYYSYDLGAWHIVVLNSIIAMSVGSAQEQWLRADLAASRERCTLAYWEHPRFSSSLAPAVRGAVKPLWDALYDAGAEVVLNGHDRVYERFAPQSPEEEADPETGIRQFTVGTGGHGVNVFGPAVRPNSEVRLSGTYGVLKLTLGDGTYAWRFLPIAGQTGTDSGSGTCHDAPPPVASVTVSPEAATVLVGQTVQLTATLKDASGNALSGRTATWSSGNTAIATVDGNGLVTGKAAGSVTITATSEGRSGAATVTVTVPNRTPTAAFSFSCGGLSCAFTDLSSDADGWVVAAWNWDFGDGTTSTSRNPSHYYGAGGSYTVRLTVTDTRGATGSASQSVTAIEGAGSWTTKAAMPTARVGLGVAAIDGILYSLGGDTTVDDGGGALPTLEAYDPGTNAWTTRAAMPTPRWGLGVAAVDGILYAVGGEVEGEGYSANLATVEAYDPRTNTWTTKASMPTPRYGLGVAAIDGILYAVGGSNGNGDLATLEAYDPRTNTWTTKAWMPTPRYGLVAGLGVAAFGGILYVVGGYNDSYSESDRFLATVEAYDPRTNTWTTRASMPTPRAGLGVATIGGILYAVGGSNFRLNPMYRATVEAYDPGTDTWTPKQFMTTPRTGLGVAVIGGILYAVGGYSLSDGLLATLEAYHP